MKQTIPNVPYVRWYFNKSDNIEKSWSIDQGPGTCEMICCMVVFKDIEVAYSQVVGAKERLTLPKDAPTAWLETRNVTLEIDSGGNIDISIISIIGTATRELK